MSGEQHQHELNEALKALSARLERIEARLGMAPPTALPTKPAEISRPEVQSAPTDSVIFEEDAGALVEAPPLNAAPLVPPSPPREVPRMAPPSVPPVRPQPLTEPARTQLEELARRRFAAQAAGRADVAAPVAPPVFSTVVGQEPKTRPAMAPAPQRPARPGTVQEFSLERLVGGRLYAVLGALIVGVGLIMLLKLGLDRGWFRFPPEFRCIGVALFGGLMIGAGEFVRRKFGNAGVMAGAGLAGAGIAAIYGAVLAAFGMYHLIGAPAAFTMLVVVSAGGIALSLHAKSLALSILSLVGAYLNPLCLMALGAPKGSPLVMPSYLTALLALGLVLSAWRPLPFRWLRGVAWWGTVILGTIWIVADGEALPLLSIPFLGLVWAMVHAELVIGARRLAEGQAGAAASRFIPTSLREVRPLLSSFATTIWSVGAGTLIAKFTSSTSVHLDPWWVSAAGLIGTGIAGFMLAGHLRAFRDVPETDGERLGVVLWVQAGALLITTVALGLSTWAQTVAWLSMGVAAIGAGRWLRAKGLEGYGLIVLVIAVGRLLTWDLVHLHVGGGSPNALGLIIDEWTLLMAIGGAAWCGCAWMLSRPSGEAAGPSLRRRTLVDICTGIGLTLMCAGLLHHKAADVSLAGVGIVWGLLVLGVAKGLNRTLLRYWGMAALMLVTVVSLLVMFATVNERYWTCAVGPLVLSDWSLVLLVAGGAWLLGSWLVNVKGSVQAEAASSAAVAIGCVAMMLALLAKGTSVGAVCVVWVWIGLSLVGAHHFIRRRGLDVMGLVALGATVLLWAENYLIEEEWLSAKTAGLTHPGLWIGLVIVAALIGAAAWLRRGTPMRGTSTVMIRLAQAVAGVLLLGCTSMEVARSAGVWFPESHTSQAAALTIWWAVFGVGMLIAGFAVMVPIIRHVGLGLLGVAAVKALIWDMASVAAEWRVASFIGVGLLMLGVAVGYAKVSAKLEREAKKAEEEDMKGIEGELKS
jgi:hypothetical protein